MKTNSILLISIQALTLIGIFSFKILKTNDYLENKENIVIHQQNNEIILQSESQINIKREKFSIRFSNKAYNSSLKEFNATQIAAFLDKSELSKIKIGVSVNDIPCFAPGTGMAPSENGFYESITFENSAHHYLFYENQNDRRVNLINENKNILRLEFPVNKFNLNGKDVKIEKTKLSEFYLAIFIDSNFNDIIDMGELTKVTVEFL